MTCVTSILSVLLCAAVAGCGGLPRPITDPDERFSVGGATVSPPAHGPWQIYKQEDEVLLFFRGTEIPERKVFATVAILTETFDSLADFRDHLRRTVRPDPTRFRNVRTDFELAEGPEPFVRGLVSMDSIASDGVGGERMESRSRQYLHPDGGRQVILSVTQRCPEGMAHLDLDSEVAGFFGGLRFDTP